MSIPICLCDLQFSKAKLFDTDSTNRKPLESCSPAVIGRAQLHETTNSSVKDGVDSPLDAEGRVEQPCHAKSPFADDFGCLCDLCLSVLNA